MSDNRKIAIPDHDVNDNDPKWWWITGWSAIVAIGCFIVAELFRFIP